jgi:ubiquinone/menaquinone biosynthesis C-methylase UbiE
MRREIIDYYQKTWKDFDSWYDKNQAIYKSELAALKKVIPPGIGLEIGVGTGRFAEPLSVRFGLDPAFNMLKLAKQRGILLVQGVGENLPFKNESFHFVLIVFTIELVDDTLQFLKEALRPLKKKGALILGIIDRNSLWGQYYEKNSSQRKFFHFLSPEEILEIFRDIDLEFKEAYQTLFQAPPDIKHEEEPRRGFGQGGLVVFKTIKKS